MPDLPLSPDVVNKELNYLKEGSPEGMQYMAAGLREKAGSQPGVKKIADAAEHLAQAKQHIQDDTHGCWQGQLTRLRPPLDPRLLADLENAQDEYAHYNIERYAFTFAVGKRGEFLRGIALLGAPPAVPTDQQKIEEKVDNVFRGWLKSHDMEERDGVVFKGGRPIDPATFAALAKDEERGFSATVKRSGGMRIELRQQPYSAPAPVAQERGEEVRGRGETRGGG